MLHACAAGAHALRPLARRLSQGRRVICLDFDGYGVTEIAESHGDALQRHRRALRLLLQHLDLPAYDLFGHSMGGFVALHSIAQGEARPRRLILSEPTVFAVLNDAVPEQAEAKALDRAITAELAAAVAAGEPERGMAAFMELWNEVPWRRLPDAIRSRLVALAPQVAREAMLVCNADAPAHGFAAIDCPVLLLHGEHAPPPIAALVPVLADLLPSPRRRLIAGAGHMGPVTLPDAFASVIEGFLDKARTQIRE